MFKKRKIAKDSELSADFTPIIDCAFNLLIFFILTLKFSTSEGQLSAELPKEIGVNERPDKTAPPLDALRIYVRYDAATREATFVAGTATTTRRPELLAKVRNFLASSRDVPIEIAPDAAVPYRFLVLVLDVCREAGATKIQFSGIAYPLR